MSKICATGVVLPAPRDNGKFKKNFRSSAVNGAVMFRLSPLRNTVEPLVLVMLAENVSVCPGNPVSSDELKLMANVLAKAHAENRAKSARARNIVRMAMVYLRCLPSYGIVTRELPAKLPPVYEP